MSATDCWINTDYYHGLLAAFYYEMMVPWYQVHYREVSSYRREGDSTIIGLEGNSQIDVDWKGRRYTLIVGGSEVAKDGDTFCPVGKDRIAFYSQKGATLSAPLPEGWNAQAVAAFALYPDHAEESAMSIGHGRVTVDAVAGRPVMVFRDGAAARKKMAEAR